MNTMTDVTSRVIRSMYRRIGALPADPDTPVIASGDNVRVRDTGGRCYLDMTAGGGRALIGHRNPAIADAVVEQCLKLMDQPGRTLGECQVRLMEQLVSLAGGRYRQVMLTESDHEAMALALRVAARVTGRVRSWHVIHSIPVSKQVPEDVASVVVTPVERSDGLRIRKAREWRELAAQTRKAGALLVWDERFCGCGRSGTFLMLERLNIRPDLVVLGGPLGGGLPLGALLGVRKVAGAMSTCSPAEGASPLAAAAALAFLDYLSDHDLAREAVRKGVLFRRALSRPLPPHVTGIHGVGLMLGLTLTLRVGPILKRLARLGVLADAAGEGAIALLPPLTISPSQIEVVTDTIRTVLASADYPDRPGA